MVNLSQTFHLLQPFKVLVLGDFLLDTYTTGKVRRISPEAPVPVMEVLRHEARPGGAGNVALNLQALGGRVVCVGRIGADLYGEQLKQLLSLEGIDHSTLMIERGYITPVKNRLIAESQQLMRIDSEIISPLNAELESLLIEQLKILIGTTQIIALSDYGKGFLTGRMIRATLEIAKTMNIPVIVDPKGTDFAKYRGATILKPNLSEAYAAVKKPLSTPLSEVASGIFLEARVDLLLITRSEAGMSLFDCKGQRTDFPVVSKEVKDVTGAGDTVLAVLCLGLANGLDLAHVVQLSNIAAGLAIERLGCVQVTLAQIAKRLLETDNQTKIFDENHTYALEQVLKGKQVSLLVLSQENSLTLRCLKAIRQLAKKEEREMIVYVAGGEPEDELVQFLSSLHEIDTIILQKKSLKHLCEMVHPDEVYVLEEEKLTSAKEILVSLLDHSSAKT
jgi:rfaE bifunctional protein kinase chain/domain